MNSTQPIKIINKRIRTLSNSQMSNNNNLNTDIPLSTSLPTNFQTSLEANLTTALPTTILTTVENTTIGDTTIQTFTNEVEDSSKQQPVENEVPAVNIVIKACKNITSKQALLMIPITKFFSVRVNLNKLIEILKGESVSLRLIDWFVTNYCKKYNIIYNTSDYTDFAIAGQNNTPISTNKVSPPSFDNFIIVHNNYKGQLKAYSKRNFDPFCRRNRIRFYYEDNKYFITTVGQLNFFKWALETNLINYIIKHFNTIDDDMNNHGEIVNRKNVTLQQPINTSNANTNENTKKKKPIDGIIPIETAVKTKKNGGTRKKRTEISSSASKSLSIYNYPTTLVFD